MNKPATPEDNVRICAARIRELLSPAEQRELEEAAVLIESLRADLIATQKEVDRVCELHKVLMADADKRLDIAEQALALRGEPVVGSNAGHGHVWARPDGMKARCGGPGLCAQCSRDKALYDAPISGERVREATEEMIDVVLQRFRKEIEIHMDTKHPSSSPGHDAMRIALRAGFALPLTAQPDPGERVREAHEKGCASLHWNPVCRERPSCNCALPLTAIKGEQE